jgi:hypothetical protein
LHRQVQDATLDVLPKQFLNRSVDEWDIEECGFCGNRYAEPTLKEQFGSLALWGVCPICLRRWIAEPNHARGGYFVHYSQKVVKGVPLDSADEPPEIVRVECWHCKACGYPIGQQETAARSIMPEYFLDKNVPTVCTNHECERRGEDMTWGEVRWPYTGMYVCPECDYPRFTYRTPQFLEKLEPEQRKVFRRAVQPYYDDRSRLLRRRMEIPPTCQITICPRVHEPLQWEPWR